MEYRKLRMRIENTYRQNADDLHSGISKRTEHGGSRERLVGGQSASVAKGNRGFTLDELIQSEQRPKYRHRTGQI